MKYIFWSYKHNEVQQRYLLSTLETGCKPVLLLLEVLQCSTSFSRTGTFFPPPPRFQLTSDGPLLRKAPRSNPLTPFSKCIQNNVPSVRHCWIDLSKKTIVYYFYCIYLLTVWVPWKAMTSVSTATASFNHLGSSFFTCKFFIDYKIER